MSKSHPNKSIVAIYSNSNIVAIHSVSGTFWSIHSFFWALFSLKRKLTTTALEL